MKKIFDAPMMEITKWESEDVIATSLTPSGDVDVKASGNLPSGKSTQSLDFSSFKTNN